MKCDQYWPSRGTETYGMIQVTMLDTLELATYSVRTFALYKVRLQQGRERDHRAVGCHSGYGMLSLHTIYILGLFQVYRGVWSERARENKREREEDHWVKCDVTWLFLRIVPSVEREEWVRETPVMAL